MKPKLSVMGTLNMDLVAKVPYFPAPGETIASLSYLRSLGGKAANQAVAANRIGINVAFIGKRGGDAFGHELNEQLSVEGIDTSQLMISETKATGTSFITIDESGENMVVTNLEANTDLTEKQALGALSNQAPSDAVLFQPEMEPSIFLSILKDTSNKNIPIFVNLAPVPNIPLTFLSCIDVLILNEIEASQLTGITVNDQETAEQAVAILREHGANTIIITLGAGGVLVHEKSVRSFFQAPSVQAVDTTAAGDCFCGALTAYWLREKNIHTAAEKAVYAASLSVTRYGAMPSIPYEDEIESFKQSTQSITIKGDFQ
ncbi:ribokinase [Salibacterium sp. K-3]